MIIGIYKYVDDTDTIVRINIDAKSCSEWYNWAGIVSSHYVDCVRRL